MSVVLGVAASIAALMSCMALSYVLNINAVPLAPLMINLMFPALLLGIVAFGVTSRRFGIALGPLIFALGWAAFSEAHARIIAARTADPSLGAQPLPAIGKIDTLIVLGQLRLNSSRMNGVSVAFDNECAAWCADVLSRGLANSVLLREKPVGMTGLRQPDSAEYRQYKIGQGEDCKTADAASSLLTRASGEAARCIVSSALQNLPDGHKIIMGESKDLPTAGSICCQTVRISKSDQGQETELANWQMGNAVTVQPWPIIFLGLKTEKPMGWLDNFMLRDVPLGRQFYFDDTLEAVLGSPITWTPPAK
jgi:hypothetical protein